MVKIQVVPELAVVDEEVEIAVTEAEPNSPVTISCSIVYFDILYLGSGHFYCDSNGRLSLTEHASYGGTYSGLDPMGLITSMKPMPSKHASPRLFVRGAVDKPLPFEINLWKGHLTQDQIHHLHIKHLAYGTKYPSNGFLKQFFLDACVLQRTYMSPNIERIPVRIEVDNEPIRGFLFVPSGKKGPFPGIIDVFGAIGGSMEFRSALLAKRGYAAFALVYYAFEDLKAKTSSEFTMSYFDKAINWFVNHPLVKAGGVGMLGNSLGAEICLISSIRNENVKATVCLNTTLRMHADPRVVNPISHDKQGTHIYEIWHGQRVPLYKKVFPVDRPVLTHKHDNPILFLLGSEDIFSPCIDYVIDQLQRSGKKNVVKKVLQGQGHFLEPAYWPQCMFNSSVAAHVPSSNPYENLFRNLQQQWGGSPKNHGKVQLEGWKFVLDFFAKHLNTDFPSSKL